jgi:hypothetical protein
LVALPENKNVLVLESLPVARFGPKTGQTEVILRKKKSFRKDSAEDLFFICGILTKTDFCDYHLQ